MLLVIGLLVGQLGTWGTPPPRRGEAAHATSCTAWRSSPTGSRRIPGPSGCWTWWSPRSPRCSGSTACRFSLARPEAPELGADGSVDASLHDLVDGEFALPPDGVVVRVEHGGELLGWLHLVPAARAGVPLETRKVAVALSQQLGSVLARPTAAGAGPTDR